MMSNNRRYPAVNPPNAEPAQLVARARLMMIISALTTVIAIAAVVSVIGYRVFTAAGAARHRCRRHRHAAEGRAHDLDGGLGAGASRC